AVDDEVAAAVRAGMDSVLDDIDAAEMRTVILTQEFVVIAGDVDDLGALARLAQHLLHQIVVRLRPVPVRLQRPAVDDVTDQVDGVGIMVAEKIEQLVGLRAAGSEMDIGDKQSAKAPLRAFFTCSVTSHIRALTDSHDKAMNNGRRGRQTPLSHGFPPR